MAAASLRARVVTMALLFTACCLAAGCGKSKITKENFDQIEKGMTMRQVEKLLGGAGTPQGDGSLVAAQVGVDVGGGLGGRASPITEYTWTSGDKSITVGFQQEKVVGKPRQTGL